MHFRESHLINKEIKAEKKAELEGVAAETIINVNKHGLAIGKGKTAEIKILDKENAICVKIVDINKVRREKIPLTNYVDGELDFLDKLNDQNFLKSIGISQKIIAPKPLFSYSENGYGFLFMERIKGASLREVFDGTNQENTPKNINWPEFLKKLKDIITKLNTANIYHRDLHPGNIMIDEQQEPIIIDFGNAYESFYSEDTPYTEMGMNNQINYHKDSEYIKEIEKEIEKIEILKNNL
ncbi:protein kinase family protein [Patescibacteria group bacterium]|nr:protein kinase family protein [Patescibacteria group bacterium]